MNYRMAELSDRHRAMLDFVWDLTDDPEKINEAARQSLRDAGFSDEGIWDIAETAAFFNYTNRMAHAVEMMPNEAYHGMNRTPKDG